MQKLFSYQTAAGRFYIARKDDFYHTLYGDEDLGAYLTISQLLDDLSSGNTRPAGEGIDIAALGIPDVLSDWDNLFL